MALAAGVDVSATRGLDVVVLDARRRPVTARARVEPGELAALLDAAGPQLAVVAIDSPPGPGEAGRTRPCEIALRRRHIRVFSTPAVDEGYDRPFFDWVRAGEEAFAAAEAAGFPRLRHRGAPAGHALEVFPHATDVVLRGATPPPRTLRSAAKKRAWRAATLAAAGVDTGALRSVDLVDAALAALTGLLALADEAELVGEPPFLLAVPARALTARA